MMIASGAESSSSLVLCSCFRAWLPMVDQLGHERLDLDAEQRRPDRHEQ